MPFNNPSRQAKRACMPSTMPGHGFISGAGIFDSVYSII